MYNLKKYIYYKKNAVNLNFLQRILNKMFHSLHKIVKYTAKKAYLT